MYEVRVNIAKNRLYITLAGFFADEAEVIEIADTVKASVDQLQPGFDVVNDIHAFKPASPDIAKYIMAVQQYELEHGLNRVVRITGDEVIGKMQFERLSRETGIHTVGAATVEEADAILDAI